MDPISDIETLCAGAAQLEHRLRTIPTLQDVTSDLQIENPQVDIHIDRDRAAALGLTLEQIERRESEASWQH